MGGLDVFCIYFLNFGNWVLLINLKLLVNLGGDDFGFVVDCCKNM